jgi:hypothetical protein
MLSAAAGEDGDEDGDEGGLPSIDGAFAYTYDWALQNMFMAQLAQLALLALLALLQLLALQALLARLLLMPLPLLPRIPLAFSPVGLAAASRLNPHALTSPKPRVRLHFVQETRQQ